MTESFKPNRLFPSNNDLDAQASVVAIGSNTSECILNPNTFTSAKFVGLNFSYTPTKTGIVLVTFFGSMGNINTGGAVGVSIYPKYGSDSPPAEGDSPTGKGSVISILHIVGAGVFTVGYQECYQTTAGPWVVPFSITFVITGLTIGTTYWFDLVLSPIGGTADIQGVYSGIVEI